MSEKEKIIYRTFRTIVKEVDDKEGIIDMLIPMSTGSVDRHKESINPLGWKKSLKEFKKRAILVSSHRYDDLRKQIGEFIEMEVSKEGLFAKPKYYINQGNDEADWGFTLAKKGMAAFSVGFIPIKWQDAKETPTRTYLEQELVEISHVIVPSNRDAIQKMRSESEDPILNEVIDDILKEEGLIEIEKKGEEKGDEEILEKGVITKPEETEKLIRIPAKGEEGKHKGHKIRWITVSAKEGIRGIYCIDCKKIITFVFDKAKGWTMEKAKKWMKDHGKTVENYFLNIDPESVKEVELEEIDWEKVEADIEKDEKLEKLKKELEDYPQIKYVDTEEDDENINIAGKQKEYIVSLIVKENKELIEKNKELELKAGAVLNAKLKGNLKDALNLIQLVLDSNREKENKEGEGDSKKGDKITDKADGKKEDPGKGEEKDEDDTELIKKIVAETVEKKMNYLIGKTGK